MILGSMRCLVFQTDHWQNDSWFDDEMLMFLQISGKVINNPNISSIITKYKSL